MKYAAIVTCAAACMAAPAVAQTFSIGTNPQGSTAYSTGAAVARVAREALDLRSRVVPQGGPVVTLPLVEAGTLSASIGNSMDATLAHAGRNVFEGKPLKDVRVVAVLRTLRVGIVVAKDSPIKTVADLKGRRISSGFAKQRNIGQFWMGMLATAGLTYDDVKGVPVPNFVRGVDDFMSGQVDAAGVSLQSGKVRQANASIGIRYLSLPDGPDAVKRLQAVAPGTTIGTVRPSPAYPGITGPTNVLAVPFVLMSGTKTADETIYRLTKALAENKALMVSVFKGLSEFDPKRMYVDFGVPYHSGAMKYYREVGLAK